MLLHGVETPGIRYRDSLGQDHAGEILKSLAALETEITAGMGELETMLAKPAPAK